MIILEDINNSRRLVMEKRLNNLYDKFIGKAQEEIRIMT